MNKILKGLAEDIKQHPSQSLYLIWLLFIIISSYIGGMIYFGAVEGKIFVERKVNDISGYWERNRKA